MTDSSRSIGIRELKAHASAIVREVQRSGTEVIVTVRGRPIARMEPVPRDNGPEPTDGLGGTGGILAGFPNLRWEDFQAAKRIWEPGPLDSG